MSVTWKSDMELWIGSRLEIGRRSYIYKQIQTYMINILDLAYY